MKVELHDQKGTQWNKLDMNVLKDKLWKLIGRRKHIVKVLDIYRSYNKLWKFRNRMKYNRNSWTCIGLKKESTHAHFQQ